MVNCVTVVNFNVAELFEISTVSLVDDGMQEFLCESLFFMKFCLQNSKAGGKWSREIRYLSKLNFVRPEHADRIMGLFRILRKQEFEYFPSYIFVYIYRMKLRIQGKLLVERIMLKLLDQSNFNLFKGLLQNHYIRIMY